MNKYVKVAILTGIAALSIAAVSVSEVNSKVALLLTPFNTNVTAANVEFTDLNIDAVKTLDFGVRASYWRVGSHNELTFRLDNLEYHYGDGTNPNVSGRLSLDINLLKVFGQQGINEMAEGLGEMLKGMAQSYIEKYGEAIALEVSVDEIEKDPNGDVASVKMYLTAKLDYSNLPANLPVSEIEIKSMELNVYISRESAVASGYAILNPQYKGFRQDEVGLKEFVGKLLSEDRDVYDGLVNLVSTLDSFAKDMVEADNEE